MRVFILKGSSLRRVVLIAALHRNKLRSTLSAEELGHTELIILDTGNLNLTDLKIDPDTDLFILDYLSHAAAVQMVDSAPGDSLSAVIENFKESTVVLASSAASLHHIEEMCRTAFRLKVGNDRGAIPEKDILFYFGFMCQTLMEIGSLDADTGLSLTLPNIDIRDSESVAGHCVDLAEEIFNFRIGGFMAEGGWK